MQNKIKITYIIPSLDLGGAERLVTEMIKNINRDIFDVSVICLRRTGQWAAEIEKLGIKIELVGSLPKLEFLSILKIRKILRKEKPDIIHTHLFGADVYGGLAALSLGIKNIISTEHNLNYNEGFIKKNLKSFVVNKFSKIVAVSEAVKDYSAETYKIEKDKISVFHNGIHFENYYKEIKIKDQKEIILGSAGRLTTQKGFEKLILAMRYVENENIKLKIAGDGKLKYDLRHLIKKYKLEDRAVLVGPQKNIQKFYSEIDIYIQSSKWEGLGISILEAGAVGLPVIASRVDGIKEIINDGETGFLYEYDDERALAEKIVVLSKNINERKRLAENLQKKVAEEFSIFRMIEKYEKIYEQQLMKKKKVLFVNKFHYLKGGAERSYFDTANILIESGHDVAYFSMKHPENIEYNDDKISFSKKLRAIFNIWYNFSANRRLKKLIKEFRPDVAHLHNIYHQISPSIINVLKKKKIPIVYTLHDYKLISPNYSLMLNGNIWEKTKKKKYYKCFFDKCVKDSYLKSLVSIIEAYLHDFLGLYRKVDEYISPSNFLIEKFEDFGFENEINYLPNPLSFESKNIESEKDYFLYYGRLSKEKGIFDLLSAFSKSKLVNKLYIVGDGPEREKIEDIIKEKNLGQRVFLLGYKKGNELEKIINESLAVIVPSRWYENAPYTIIEAMNVAKIVVASRVGGLSEMIQEGETGFLYNFADTDDLSSKLLLVSNLDIETKKSIGVAARRHVSRVNSRENYYKKLIAIYSRAEHKVKLRQKRKGLSSVFTLIVLAFLIPINTIAIFGFVKNNNYPKLANYFLNWEISNQEAVELAKWDLLVLDMEVQTNSREQVKKIRQYNPDIIILAYVTAGEIRQDACSYNMSMLRCELFNKIDDEWYLLDAQGDRTVAWPGTNMMNLGSDDYNTNNSWNDTLPKFVYYKLMTTGLWDGVFYDTVWHDLYWVNNGELDINSDGQNDNIAYVNERYKNGVARMFSTTRNLFGESYIILENGSSHVAYQSYINGMMYESFPTPWEGAGYWPNIMKSYLEKESLNVEPKIQIINANSKNQNDLRKMREGLGSALLGNAYYSFDFGETHHGQTWWYDEYNLDLGAPISSAFRVDGPDSNYEQGIWRRNFEKGVVFVNSYDRKINYNLEESFLLKINSNKEEILIDKIELEARDSIILFYREKEKVISVSKTSSESKESTGPVNMIKTKIKEEVKNIINETKAKIVFTEKPMNIIYSNVSLGKFNSILGGSNIVDSNKDALFEKVIGTNRGDESRVNIIDNNSNRLLGVFPVYPGEFRCGAETAVGDFDGDGTLEIATVPDWGGPHLKIFDFSGKLKNELFFNDRGLRAYYGIKSVYDNSIGRDILFLTSY
jgi:glycosyltransferase involved in cell wall biosynthesis